MSATGNDVPIDRVERSILLRRGGEGLGDRDLADIYGVETKALNQAVKRNAGRFPADVMFQLAEAEKSEVVTNCGNLARIRFSPHLPCSLAERGALMLANVLNSERTAQTSVLVVRAFVRLRQLLSSNADLARNLESLDQKYDAQFKIVFDAVRHPMSPPARPKREIACM